jgi:hypothetical protein
MHTAVSTLGATPTATASGGPVPAASAAPVRLGLGMAVGLAAASISALYAVFARWGIAQGLQALDLTVLRFGVRGLRVHAPGQLHSAVLPRGGSVRQLVQ